MTRSGKRQLKITLIQGTSLSIDLKKGKEKILGTVKNVLPDNVRVASTRQSNALGLGHAVLCAKLC